jgi:hypothetical protein
MRSTEVPARSTVTAAITNRIPPANAALPRPRQREALKPRERATIDGLGRGHE